MGDQYSVSNGPPHYGTTDKGNVCVCVQIMPYWHLMTIISHSMQSFMELCFVFNGRK